MRWWGSPWRQAGVLLVALGAAGCAMSEAVRRGDQAYAAGDTSGAVALYEQAVRDTYLTRGELAHVVGRLEAEGERELRRRLEELEARLGSAPAEQVLAELTALHSERVSRWWSDAQERLMREARQRALARGWGEVEALETQRRYRAALERALALARFFHEREPVWEEVRRLEASFRASPVEPPLLGQPLFSPGVEPHLRKVAEALERRDFAGAQRELVDAAQDAGQPFEDFMNAVIAAYGLELPFMERQPPLQPALPEGLRLTPPGAWTPKRHGQVGRTGQHWTELPEEDQPAARGFWAGHVQGEVLLLHLPDIPTQPDRLGLYAGQRLEFSLLANALGGWGWALHDSAQVEFFLGGRLSPAHEYPSRVVDEAPRRESAFCIGGVLAYELLLGYRGSHAGLLVGARPQLTAYQVGDVTASGAMLPLVARLELRGSERFPLILHGWLTPSRDGSTTHGLMLQVPWGTNSLLFGRYEALSLDTRMGGLRRSDRIDLGWRDSSLFTLGVGWGM